MSAEVQIIVRDSAGHHVSLTVRGHENEHAGRLLKEASDQVIAQLNALRAPSPAK